MIYFAFIHVLFLNVMSLAPDTRHDGIIRQTLTYNGSMGYEPLRIHMVYSDVQCRKISLAVDKAVKMIMQLLHVVPVKQNILLRSDWCHKENKEGRCVSLKRNYGTQTCGDSMIVPNSHLEGLVLWNDTHPVKTVSTSGDGVPDADFILYVDSVTTGHCLGEHPVLSYTQLCQVDQYDRPIAGYLNVCPNDLCTSDNVYSNERKLYEIVVHELFHLLGFSKSHFGYFKKCDIGGTGILCQPLDNERIKEMNGNICMMTPSVLRETQRLFGCLYNSTFCVQLDAKGFQYTSHWSIEFLPYSIMTPYLGATINTTLIDRITLAVFEDCGWYKVNYSLADRYHIDSSRCVSTMKFCSESDQAMCTKKSSHGYDNILLNLLESCRTDKGSDVLDEVYSENSACFLSNITDSVVNASMSFDGRCYHYLCKDNGEIMIKIRTSSWMACPFGNLIKIPGYFGNVKCPTREESICPYNARLSTTSLSPKIFSTESRELEYKDTITDPMIVPKESTAVNKPHLCTFIFCVILTSCH